MLPLEIFVPARIFLQKVSCVHEFFSDLTKIFMQTRIFLVLHTVLSPSFHLQLLFFFQLINPVWIYLAALNIVCTFV